MFLNNLRDQWNRVSQSVYLFIGNALVLFILVNEMIVAPVYPEAKIQAARHNAVALARSGESAQAAERLQAILRLAPDNQKVRIDYLVVLNWQGEHELALAQLHNVVLSAAPDYFFEAMIDSALQAEQIALAQSLIQSQPNPQVSVGLSVLSELSAAEHQFDAKNNTEEASSERVFRLWLMQKLPDDTRLSVLNTEILDETPSVRVNERESEGVSGGINESLSESLSENASANDKNRLEPVLGSLGDSLGDSPVDSGVNPMVDDTVASPFKSIDTQTDNALTDGRDQSLKASLSQLQSLPQSQIINLDKQEAVAQSDIDAIEDIKQIESDSIERVILPDLTERARQARVLGDLSRAQGLYRQALFETPNDKQARLGLALVLAEQKQFGESLARLNQALAIAPTDTQTLHALIYYHQLKGDIQSELEAIARLLAVQPREENINNWVSRLIANKDTLGDEAVFNHINRLQVLVPQSDSLRHNKIALLEQQSEKQQNVCGAVLSYVPAIQKQDSVPPYVFEAMLRCARVQRTYAAGRALLESARQMHPEHKSFVIFAALLDVDQGNPEAALQKLDGLSFTRFPERLAENAENAERDDTLNARDYFNARAYAMAALPNPAARAMAYYDVLTRWPDDQVAFIQWCLALSEAGSAITALENAQVRWGLFSLPQKTRLKHNVAAHAVRRALRGHVDPHQAQQRNDAALAAVNHHLSWLAKHYATNAPPMIKARFDQVIALQRANKLTDAIAHFQALQAEQVAIPDYVKSSVADAYLGLKKPQDAQALAESIIAKTPTHYAAQSGRYYALLEQEYYQAAGVQGRTLQTTQPVWRASNNNKIWRPNPARLSADRMVAMHQAFESQLAQAQHNYEQKLKVGPANTDIRNDLATVYRYRGWPEAALEEVSLIHQTEPALLAANVNAGWIFQALQDYPRMSRTVDTLKQRYPTHRAVGKLSEAWDRVNMLEFASEVSQLQGRGTFFDGNVVRFENQLYSPPIHYHYRLFTHSYYQDGEFPDKTQVRVSNQYPAIAFDSHFIKTGIEYRYKRNTAALSLVNRAGAGEALGFQWRHRYQWNDHLQFEYAIDQNSENISLGSDYWGITLDRLALGGQYRFHEGRTFGLAVSRGSFSESDRVVINNVGSPVRIAENTRLTGRAYHEHRLFENALHTLTLTESLAWMDNDNSDSTVYYSPSQVSELNVSLRYDGVIARSYDKVFRHALALGAGPVIQAGNGEGGGAGVPTKLAASLYYEQRWQWERRFNFFYGARLSQGVYDGERELLPEFLIGFRGLFR